MNYIDLFSGIGGFRLGLDWAEIKCKNYFFSEIDEYCNKLYKQNFPDSIKLGDIKKINCKDLKKKYGKNWIITGGFPCQDLSIAGKRRGILKGERSNLWFEMLRIISGIRPKICIIENVPGLIISGGLGIVLSGLAEIGYNAEWQSISAVEMGAWHKRERIWIITYPNSERLRYKQKPEYKCKRKNELANNGPKKSQKAFPNSNSSGLQPGRKSNKYNKTRKETGNKFFKGLCKKNVISYSTGQVLEGKKSKSKLSDQESRLLAKCSQWKFEPGICRVVDGIPKRVDRIKSLGNAIVPQISYILFLKIKKYLNEF